jgi:hypothetical protein
MPALIAWVGAIRWPASSNSNVIGPLIAYEVITAFCLETDRCVPAKQEQDGRAFPPNPMRYALSAQ